MLNRLLSLFFLSLSLGLLLLSKSYKDNVSAKFSETIPVYNELEEQIAKNEYIILLNEGYEQRLTELLNEFDLELLNPIGEWIHVAKDEVMDEQELIPLASNAAKSDEEVLSLLKMHPAIDSVYLNHIEEAEASIGCLNIASGDLLTDKLIVPHDPLFKLQWHLNREQGIDVQGAWAITIGNALNLIAVVDRNFDFSQDDLAKDHCPLRQYYYENVLDYFPQKRAKQVNDQSLHGSKVLSVLAPCTDNSVGLSGIDWQAQVFGVDTKADRSLSARMFGILWAAGIDVCTSSITGCPRQMRFQKNQHPANIINASFGFAGAFLKDPPYAPVLDIIGHVNRQGKILIASTGNEGGLADRRLPGAAGGVISVAASTKERKSASFSNWGRSVDVLAPGKDIVSLGKNGPILLNGTSFAAPIVAGVVSLMVAVNPHLSWKQAEYILKKSATPMSCNDYCPAEMKEKARKDCLSYCCPQGELICSSGIINAKKAVELAKEGIPKVPLVDVDDYYLPLSETHSMQREIMVKNWGHAPALVRMKKTHKHLKIYPEQLSLPPASANGLPSSKKVLLYFDKIPQGQVLTSLVLEAVHADKPDQYVDQIEAIVDVVPIKQARKKKFRELLR